jgi:FK506-binding nuclear protein
MPFFSELVGDDPVEVEIPEGLVLHLLQACVDLKTESYGEVVSLYVGTPNEDDDGAVLCHLKAGQVYQSPLTHEFRNEDSPVSVWTNGGAIHLTGKWEQYDEVEGMCGFNDDEEATDDSEDDGEDAECPDLVPVPKVEVEPESRTNKRKHEDSENTQPVESSENKPAAATKVESKKDKKAKKEKKNSTGDADEEVPIVVANKPVDDNTKLRKKWNVKPQNEEGVLVPEPKQLTKSSGVKITDYVIGAGKEPKLGSKVQITYEGMFPDGKMFDSNLKRTKPFTFRKGNGDVVRGMDLGLEGMRVGGSREIVIPGPLG